MRASLTLLGLVAALVSVFMLMPDSDPVIPAPEPAAARPPAIEAPAELRPLPESEMRIILEVFVPELWQP